MAKYRLVQENDIIRFNLIPEFNDLKSDNLKDIIKFTGVFKNQDELKSYLEKYELIKTNKPFKITYRFRSQDNNLRYGVTYKDDIPFIDDINAMRFLEQNKNNYELLNSLCNHYKNTYINGANIYAIRAYLMKLNKVQAALDDESEIVKDFEYAIRDFVRRECYRYDKRTNKTSLNFRGMRDLGMFLSCQAKKDEMITLNNMDHSNELLEYVNSKNIEKIEKIELPKTKTKKKEFPGQMSFIINNGNVTI